MHKKIKPQEFAVLKVSTNNNFMPAAGLEPARCCHQQILSLPRLPIPTSRRPKISILKGDTIFNNKLQNMDPFFKESI